VLTTSSERVVRRRTRRDPHPRFLGDISGQLDALMGCPELQLPSAHPARQLKAVVDLLDTSALRKGYSSLGRRGHDPARLLVMWIYASTIGVHHASALARMVSTDAALRWLAGGHTPSAATLKRFRQRHGDFFRDAITQTVQLARQRGLLELDEIALDSMRLRAHASSSRVRRRQWAQERLESLLKLDADLLTPEQRAVHDASIARNRAVLDQCERRDVASFVETNELAALMRFPHGGALVGHRVTATAAGASQRFVIGVLVDAAPTDHGKLPEAVTQTLGILEQLGLASHERIRVLADAGYWDAESIRYADSLRERVDVLIADARPKPERNRLNMFAREQFVVSSDERSVTCPAGKPMKGPESAGRGSQRWFGVGCDTCELRPQCTKGRQRKFEIQTGLEAPRARMRARLQRPDDKSLYRKRPAIIEPVFASVQHEMAYRRASSRHTPTVVAEVLLKLLAHNVRRLAAASRLSVVWIAA
jgi:transposase